MNKRMKKKITMYGIRKTKLDLRKENERLTATIAQLNVDKFVKDETIRKLQSNLEDSKAAHVVDYSDQIKEITKLRAQNKDLADANWELNQNLREVHHENNQLSIELCTLKNRNIFERVMNRGA